MESNAFIQKVADNANQAVKHGKTLAIRHYMHEAGSDEAEAEAFYYGVKAVCSQAVPVLNLSPECLMSFLETGEYRPLFENAEMQSKFNAYARRREQAERAIGCFGLSPTYASITMLPAGDRGYGKCAMRLEGIENNAILLCGDSFRLRNPSRSDYESDPGMVLYPFAALADCKAASIIVAMGKHDLSAGPAQALLNIMDPEKEFGRCEALIFSKVTSSHVVEIVSPSIEESKNIRRALLSKMICLPVVTADATPIIISPAADAEPLDDPAAKISPRRHFCVGDGVATKPMPSHPRKIGTVIDSSNGSITVEWTDKNRSIFDMVEALMRLMEAPQGKVSSRSDDMIVYSMPGMDDKTVLILSAAGVDPVSLYSLATHHSPASDTAMGGLENMVTSMASLGLQGTIIKGFVPSTGDFAFEHKEWVETRLATGARLVVDLDPSGLKIHAGSVEDYIKPVFAPTVQIE